MRIIYSKTFMKQFKKIPKGFQEEVNERIKLFKENPENPTFKIHKLHGRLSQFQAFSINYNYRIIFEKTKEFYIFAEIGNHDIYQ
jgi:addiction module RelE/StbE family toxin